MTLEQAIEFCLHMSEEQYQSAHNTIRGDYPTYEAAPHFRLASEYKQIAEWLTEYKNQQEENKVLISECDRLIKEKGELLKKSERTAEYAQLLKVAVEDIGATVANVYNGGLICKCCKWKSQMGECCCPDDRGCDVVYRWRHADEALKLIGDEPNGI